jgi:uncharacterized protein DUF87
MQDRRPRLSLYSGRPSLRSLSKMGYSCYTIQQEFQHVHQRSYSLRNLPIGIGDADEIFNINFSRRDSSTHVLILGGTGTGKTFMTQRIWNCFHKAGGAVAIPTDLKPEYFSASKPSKTKFHKFMLPDEVRLLQHNPVGFPVKSYRPFFLTKATDVETMKGEVTAQIALQDLNESDLDTVMNISDMTDQKRVLISNAFQMVKDGKTRDIDGMCKEIEKPENEGHPQTKKSISAVLKSIQAKGVIGDRFDRMNFVGDLSEGKVPIMNLMGAFRSGSADHYSAAYVTIVLRQLLDAKQEGKLPKRMPLMIVLDEVNRYAAATDDNIAKREVLRALDMARQYGISICFSSQDLGRIPDTILNQCKYVFVGYDLPPDQFREIIRKKEPHKVTDPYNFTQETSHVLGSMRKYVSGTRDWLFIDSTKRDDDYKIFKPLAPLSATREVGD